MTVLDDDWLREQATIRVMAMLQDAGKLAYFVGGCVRNSLIGMPVADIDIATDARPRQVMELAEKAGLKAIATGIEHGTVTVVSGGKAHEVTTFRKDIDTDGRRAKVSFSDNIEDDAHRRDFTMNALYADQSGKVLDPVGGLPDLHARLVRFIDDPRARIREDYLRILRFFRFHAWYGDPDRGLDQNALAAIAENVDGLEILSRERVGAETKKLLLAPDPSPSTNSMQTIGVLARLLPGADARPLAKLVHLEGNIRPDAIRRLAVLGGEDVAKRLRLSRAETKRLALLRDILGSADSIEAVGYRYGAGVAVDAALVRAALLDAPLEDGFVARAEHGAKQKFPIAAADLSTALQGPEIGRTLKKLEQRWIASGFQLSKDELLSQ